MAGQVVSAIVMLSISRIEGLGILRLHAWGTHPQLSMPMDPKYFYFIQNIGAYHLIIEDIPHMLAVANKQERQNHEYSWVDVVTLVFSGAACAQAFVRWFLWIGRNRDVELEPEPEPETPEPEPLTAGGQSRAERQPSAGVSRPASPGLSTELLGGAE